MIRELMTWNRQEAKQPRRWPRQGAIIDLGSFATAKPLCNPPAGTQAALPTTHLVTVR
jgi:hypothetical protein